MQLESYSVQKDLSPFTRIVHKGLGELVLKKGDKYAVNVVSKKDFADHVSFNVVGDELRIKMKDPVETGLKSLLSLSKPDIRIEVTFKELQKVEQRGVGKIISSGVLELYTLSVENRGIGEVVLNVDVKELYSDLDGVGNITLIGSADKHECTMQGTGKIEARELICEEAHVVSNGVGNATVYASKKLLAELKGVGKITYYGDPNKVESRINGMGSIVAG